MAGEIGYAMRQKDCDMEMKRLLSCLLGAVGVAWGASAAPGAFLSPANTADNPYTFTDQAAGTDYVLPSDDYPEWRVFNAASTTAEAASTYTIATDDRGTSYLAFSQALAEDLQAYLTLGIINSETGPQKPLSVLPTDPTQLRLDNVYATVRFVLSDTAPDMETLQEMYPSYEESLPSGDTGLTPTPTAAKLGVCVLQDGYFYVSRVVSGANGNPGTGRPEDLDFQFCKTNHTYDEVGGGAVTVRIEFCSYAASVYDPITRGFRIWVRDANDPDAAEICLTEGLGYRWLSDPEVGYRFDFSSLEGGEGCDWFYLIDSAMAATGTIGLSSLDTLSQLGFSATDGGFYAAWLAQGSVQTADALAANYELGAFADYFTADIDNPVTAWASRHGVNLTDWLQKKSPVRLMAAADAGGNLTDYAFNAFLLDMDPSLGAELRLTVTGIVPEQDVVTLTVRGPEGSSLKRATAADRVGRICVSRAETLDALADAPIERIDSLAFDGEGNATIVLPRGERETPFMKVTLQASKDVE